MPAVDSQWSQVSSLAFGWRVIAWVTMIGIGALLTVQSDVAFWIAGIILMGLAFAHGVELSHQALHNTAFVNLRLNEVVGLVLGLPMLVSFYEYKHLHLRHHAKVGTMDDSEYFDYGSGAWSLPRVIAWLSMAAHYKTYIKNLCVVLRGKQVEGFPERKQFKIRLFYLISFAGALTLIGLGVLNGRGLHWIVAWISSMLLIATPVHALIEFPEHYGCQRDVTDIFRNTRSISSNCMMHWFTNYNNFHVEHHLHPWMPLQNAPKLYALIAPRHHYQQASYFKFYRALISDIWRGRNERGGKR